MTMMCFAIVFWQRNKNVYLAFLALILPIATDDLLLMQMLQYCATNTPIIQRKRLRAPAVCNINSVIPSMYEYCNKKQTIKLGALSLSPPIFL